MTMHNYCRIHDIWHNVKYLKNQLFEEANVIDLAFKNNPKKVGGQMRLLKIHYWSQYFDCFVLLKAWAMIRTMICNWVGRSIGEVHRFLA